jgi:hypothetical protein
MLYMPSSKDVNSTINAYNIVVALKYWYKNSLIVCYILLVPFVTSGACFHHPQHADRQTSG